MQHRYVLLAFSAALMLILAFADGGDAQAPGKKGKKGGPFPSVTADQIVERIMSFDKNNDGKITMDELPERMQHLIALGDLNKDGALDKNEVSKLSASLESSAGLTNGGPKGGGFKGGPFKGSAGEAQRTLDDLNLTGSIRKKADDLMRAHRDKLRLLEELARAELILQMKDVLNEEAYRSFKSSLDRPNDTADVSARIDQLQKELENLRRQLPK